MRRKIRLSIWMFFISVLLVGCAQREASAAEVQAETAAETAAETELVMAEEMPEVPEAERTCFAMDTYITLQAYGDRAQEAVDAAEAEIERLDTLLSTGNEESEVSGVNRGEITALSEDTAYLIERSLELWEDTDGVFNIAIYPVMEAWGFPTEEYTVPEAGELQELLALTDVSDIHYDRENKTISFAKEGMKIDLGGIAKGYTSARIMDIYRQYGVVSGLVNLGGNVQLYGTKMDGSLWRIGIQDPEDELSYIGVLTIADRAVITSGAYERYFEQDGTVYHHIIDSSTGCPADSDLVSVTVVSADGTLADGLSTSLFVMGKERAAAYWDKHREEFDAVLLDQNGVLYVTEGIADLFSSEFDTEIITGGEAE